MNAAAIRLIFSCACNLHLAISRNSKTLHPSVRLNSVFTSYFGFRDWTRYFSRSLTARALLILFVNYSTCRRCLSLLTLCVLYATSAHLARFLVSLVVPCSGFQLTQSVLRSFTSLKYFESSNVKPESPTIDSSGFNSWLFILSGAGGEEGDRGEGGGGGGGALRGGGSFGEELRPNC